MKIILVFYSHFLALLCLEIIRLFNITKAKDNYNSEKNMSLGIMSAFLHISAEKIELMFIPEYSRI